jgi:glycosyltransferase involved in cell wall biosynthesis
MTGAAKASQLQWFLDASFDYWVSTGLATAPPRALHCYEASALRTFTRAKQLRIPCVLDVPSDHTGGIRLLQEVARTRGEDGTAGATIRPQIYTERALADYILVPADHVRQALITDGVPPRKIHTIPYGVDADQFRPSATAPPAGRPFTAIFVGKVGLLKGVADLLQAWEGLRLDDAELILVGPIEEGSLDALRATSGPTVRWAGNIPHSAVLSWYQQADIFVFPSLSEGSALVVYEALACRLPVITTPRAGSIVRDGIEGYIVPPRDIDALKGRIRTLYQDRAMRERMGRNARERVVQGYTWKHYEQRVAACYRDVVLAGRVAGECAETQDDDLPAAGEMAVYPFSIIMNDPGVPSS